jgi:hypothetical protein
MPGPKKDTAEMVWAGGFVDLLRLRPDVPWADGGAMSWSGPNSEVAAKIAPLFPEDAVEGVPLIREFCSSPLPRFRTKTALGGIWHFVIADGPFGHTGAVTLARGWRWTETPSIYESTPGECGEHGTLLYTPVELLIQDFLVHRSLTFAHQPPPSASIHSRLPGGPEFPQEGVELTRMPMPEDVVELGSPPSMTAIEIPRYQQLIERVLERLGRTPQEFVGFRHRVRYPTIPTIAVFRHPLLKRPQ